MIFICKKTHHAGDRHFIKGKEYTGIEINSTFIQLTSKDTFGMDKKWYYTKDKIKGCDCIKDWFWTSEECREIRLNEILNS